MFDDLPFRRLYKIEAASGAGNLKIRDRRDGVTVAVKTGRGGRGGQGNTEKFAERSSSERRNAFIPSEGKFIDRDSKKREARIRNKKASEIGVKHTQWPGLACDIGYPNPKITMQIAREESYACAAAFGAFGGLTISGRSYLRLRIFRVELGAIETVQQTRQVPGKISGFRQASRSSTLIEEDIPLPHLAPEDYVSVSFVFDIASGIGYRRPVHTPSVNSIDFPEVPHEGGTNCTGSTLENQTWTKSTQTAYTRRHRSETRKIPSISEKDKMGKNKQRLVNALH
ncbi:hypothetical protein C8R45DRAFT_922311 [Mycena sanguinolenta]|nr:hypothetical protein C8R45DRAFT_922311 [Mycena sanguinolenta]